MRNNSSCVITGAVLRDSKCSLDLDLLSNISKHLNKEVFVTPENAPEYKLIRVNQETIDYDLSSNPSEWPVRIKE